MTSQLIHVECVKVLCQQEIVAMTTIHEAKNCLMVIKVNYSFYSEQDEVTEVTVSIMQLANGKSFN